MMVAIFDGVVAIWDKWNDGEGMNEDEGEGGSWKIGEWEMGRPQCVSAQDLIRRVALVRSACMCVQLSPMANPPHLKSFICTKNIQEMI